MGAYLDAPIREKNPESGETELMYWGLCSMQGWRCNQEDDHLAVEITQEDGKKGTLMAVWDGHGGNEVAEFARQEYKNVFMETKEFKEGNFKEALE
jgi:serine/threonine protein phosphatase PrpC